MQLEIDPLLLTAVEEWRRDYDKLNRLPLDGGHEGWELRLTEMARILGAAGSLMRTVSHALSDPAPYPLPAPFADHGDGRPYRAPETGHVPAHSGGPMFIPSNGERP